MVSNGKFTRHRWSLIILSIIYVSVILTLILYQTSNQAISVSFPAFTSFKDYLQTSGSDAVTQLNSASQSNHQVADAKHPRMVTTLRLCEPVDHYGPNAQETREHWSKVSIPRGQALLNSKFIKQSINQSTYFWKFYELQISPERGEVRFPLLRGFQQGSWHVDWFNGDDLAWLRRLESDQTITCTIRYSDQTIKQSRFHVSALGGDSRGGPDTRPWGVCAIEYFKSPQSIELTLVDNLFPSDHSYHSQSVMLPICEFTTPVYYVVSEIKSLFSFNVDELIDWMSYHYTLGIDHFFVHYRYFLTEEQTRKLAPLISGGLLTMERWPIEHEVKERFDYHTDQDELLAMFTLRIQQHATWVQAMDFDEYLRIQKGTLYQRPCNNSLYCSSPIKDWLEEHRQHSQIQFDTVIVVADPPPEKKKLSQDIYRYQSNEIDVVSGVHLPLPVQRVWRRSYENTRLINHCKFFYQVDNMLSLATHGGSGIRPSFRDFTKSMAYVYHYHNYPIWFERDNVTATMNPQDKQARVNKFWEHEAERDTYVSDVFEQVQWPSDTNPQMMEQVKPYMGKYTKKITDVSE